MPFKICPTCQTPNGVRTHNCKKCNKSFDSAISAPGGATKSPTTQNKTGAKQTYTKKQQKKSISTGPTISIRIPGKSPNDKRNFCLIAPAGSSDEDIKEWTVDLFNYRFPYNGGSARYMREAIEYFAREFWPIYPQGTQGVNPDYRRAITIIRTTFAELVQSSSKEMEETDSQPLESNIENEVITYKPIETNKPDTNKPEPTRTVTHETGRTEDNEPDFFKID